MGSNQGKRGSIAHDSPYKAPCTPPCTGGVTLTAPNSRPLATAAPRRYTVHMSKPTGIRLDDTTRARAEAVKARAQVPVTTSAVLQEAIRRGLDEMEREQFVLPHVLSEADIAAYCDGIREGLTPLLGEHYALLVAGDDKPARNA